MGIDPEIAPDLVAIAGAATELLVFWESVSQISYFSARAEKLESPSRQQSITTMGDLDGGLNREETRHEPWRSK